MIEKYRLAGKLCHYSVGEGLPLIRAAKAKGLTRDRRGDAAPCLLRHRPDHAGESAVDADESAACARPADRAAMLEALRDGTADYLATDHAPHTIAEKERGVSGQPHLDTYGPFVTWLMVEQGFTPERIAAICSANPGDVRQSVSARRNGAACCRAMSVR